MFEEFWRDEDNVVHRVVYPEEEGGNILLLCRGAVFRHPSDANAATCLLCVVLYHQIEGRRFAGLVAAGYVSVINAAASKK